MVGFGNAKLYLKVKTEFAAGDWDAIHLSWQSQRRSACVKFVQNNNSWTKTKNLQNINDKSDYLRTSKKIVSKHKQLSCFIFLTCNSRGVRRNPGSTDL